MNLEIKPRYKQIRKSDYLGIDFREVVYLASDINYTFVHFQNGEHRLHAYTLKIFEEYLAKSANFIRIHRKFLVNQEYRELKSGNLIKLVNGGYLPIAKRRKVV
jgi:DNA-binding LytR/AlgR family response regulator